MYTFCPRYGAAATATYTMKKTEKKDDELLGPDVMRLGWAFLVYTLMFSQLLLKVIKRLKRSSHAITWIWLFFSSRFESSNFRTFICLNQHRFDASVFITILINYKFEIVVNDQVNSFMPLWKIRSSSLNHLSDLFLKYSGSNMCLSKKKGM